MEMLNAIAVPWLGPTLAYTQIDTMKGKKQKKNKAKIYKIVLHQIYHRLRKIGTLFVGLNLLLVTKNNS